MPVFWGMVSKILNFFWIILLLAGNTSLPAQSVLTNLPYIINFSKFQYDGGTENWRITATKEGFVYAANNEGLLVYDGNSWKKFVLPNQTIVRSLVVDTSSGRIYAGGQDEIGYFYKDKKGQLLFESLKARMPAPYRSFEDIWDMQIANGKVYFRTVQQAFVIDGNIIRQIPAQNLKINFLKWQDGVLYLCDADKGIFMFREGQLSFLSGSEIFVGQRVSDILKIKDETFFVSEKNGVFVYTDKVWRPFLKNSSLKGAILTSLLHLQDGSIAISSVLKGILFFDRQGNFLYSLTKKQGLQNNNIISLSADGNGNIWAGSANGIDQILINSPFSVLYPDMELEGSVYAVRVFNEKLYVGTNHGLFYTPWKKEGPSLRTSSFIMVEGSEGQVWALDEVDGDLFMCHNEGLFQVTGKKAKKISKDYTGTWRCISITENQAFIAGSYNGFQLFRKINNQWTFIQYVKGFKESARVVAKDDRGSIWVSHPYRGVYKLTLDERSATFSHVHLYGKNKGLPSDLGNYVTRLHGTIHVTSENGVYRYNAERDQFDVDSALSGVLGDGVRTRRLFQNQPGQIWFVNDTDSGILLVNDLPASKKVSKYLTPFLDGKLIGGFEYIYSDDSREVFVGTDKGLILANLDKFFKKEPVSLRFNHITTFSGETEEVLFEGLSVLPEEQTSLDYHQNTIHFSFGSNQIDPTMPLQYKTLLEGFEKEWTKFSKQKDKTYHSLRPGKYVLKVKALTGDGRESKELVFPFSVKTPWYLSKWAVVMYFLLLLSVIWVIIVFLEKKHEGEKIQLKQDIEISEARLETLKDEKLQAEIEFKNKELALSTMHILQKNEVLSHIRQELDSVLTQTKESATKNNVKKIISLLSDDQRLEEDWESFAVHFDQVHTDFLRRIKEKFPQLSNKDLKLCAYLRMNLTTKDIAPLLNISVRGVEISRYRLRKKMNISADVNLNDFMMQF